MNTGKRRQSGEPSAWVVQHAQQVPPGAVLDLACGAGRHGRYFLQLGYSVTFLDRDVSRLADLKTNSAANIMAHDLEDGSPWPFAEAQFSAVIVVNYLHRPLLSCLRRSLINDGILIYQTFAQGNERYGRPSNPDFLLAPNELLKFFGASMEIIDFQQGFQPSPDRVVQSICAVKRG